MDTPNFKELSEQTMWNAETWQEAWEAYQEVMPERHHERFWGDLKRVVKTELVISPVEITEMMIDSYRKGVKHKRQTRNN